MFSTPLFNGERIRLTSIRSTDAATIKQWYENSEFVRMYDARPAAPRSEERLRAIFNEPHGNEAYFFAIRTQYNDDLIGMIDLDSIQWNNRVAWMSIAIGDARNHGQGYGREAIQLMLHFGFRELNLHRIQLTVFSYNERAIRLYESLGFTREGVYREALHREGQRWDMYLYGILSHEAGLPPSDAT